MENQIKNKMTPAFAATAWRNNGTKAPITVRFVQVKENLSVNFHTRTVLRGVGVKNTTTQSVLVNYTEEMFNEDFASLGFTADKIINGYRSANGEITAHELNVSSSTLFDSPVYISRYETTNDLEATNDDGELKSGWSVKKVNGQELTHEGALIYSTYIFSEDGVDKKLQHDQDLSIKKVTSLDAAADAIEENTVETVVEEKAPVAPF